MGTQEAAGFKVGDRCQVADGRRGEVMFVGRVAELPGGQWVGVKYDEPDGKNDGSVKGVRYFECLDKYGGFVRPDACQCIGDFPKGPTGTPSAVSHTAAPSVSKASSLLATSSSRSKTGAADAATPSSRARDESVNSSRPTANSITRPASTTCTTRSAPSTFAAGGVPHKANRSHVAVYVRERPLSAREVKAGEQNAITLDEAENRIIVEGKKTPFGPYAAVLSPLMNNEEVFKRAVMPLVLVAASGQNASIFCFGHTGAGKTHTVMGYGAELGMYGHAGQALFDKMPKGLRLAVKCAEVYNEKVFDLLGGRVECHVKEDRDGVAQIRGDAIFGNDGSVRIKTLDFHIVADVEQLQQSVSKALASRVSGNSTLHAQSSRSHALIELEIVTDELVALREAAFVAEADLVPAGKGRDEYVMTIMSKQHDMNPATGQWVLKPGVGEIDRTEIDALEARVETLFQVAKEKKEAVEKYLSAHACQGVGGTLVLADLAGAEQGEGVNAAAQTPAERKERKQINASLLALKECIRSLHGSMPHVPFRNSKLTMLMRRYMSSDGACAAMISNICPAASQAALTTSTLMYAQLIMSAGTATPTTSTSKRCAAVDKAVERGGTGAAPARAPVDRWAPVPLPLRK